MVPIGGVIMWAGLPENIPANYHLCDGTLGTPNLVDKFVRGGDAGTAPGTTGGADTHAHGPSSVDQLQAGVGPDVWTSDPSTTVSNVPAYYEMIFIQRMS